MINKKNDIANEESFLKLSVGIPAYNEEANISDLIGSILKQKENNFVLTEIIVISDGSNDQTVNLVNAIQDIRIKLIKGKSRFGKPSRVNQILKLFKGDILVLLDGDGYLGNDFVLSNIANAFIKKKSLSFLLLRVLPLPAETWTEMAINNFFYARDNLVKEFDYRKTVYAARGAGMALSRNFAKTLKLPKIVLNDDAYIYLICKWRKLSVGYNNNAIVWFRSAQSAEDYRKQVIRYIIGGLQMKRFFDSRFLAKESQIPPVILIKILILQLIRNPFLYMFLRLNTQYCHAYVKLIRNRETVKWSMAASSKRLLLNDLDLAQSKFNYLDLILAAFPTGTKFTHTLLGKLPSIRLIKN